MIEGTQSTLFLERLQEAVKKIRVGGYRETPEPFMGSVISAETALNLLKNAINNRYIEYYFNYICLILYNYILKLYMK